MSPDLPPSGWITTIPLVHANYTARYCCASTPKRRQNCNFSSSVLNIPYERWNARFVVPISSHWIQQKIHCLRLKRKKAARFYLDHYIYHITVSCEENEDSQKFDLHLSWREGFEFGMRYTPTNFSSRFRNGRIYIYTQIDTRALLVVKIRVRMRNSDKKKKKKKFLAELCDLRGTLNCLQFIVQRQTSARTRWGRWINAGYSDPATRTAGRAV